MEGIINNVATTLPALLALGIFIFAYVLVICEEFIQLRKSKPVVVAAGIIWMLVAILAKQTDSIKLVEHSVRTYVMDFAQILLFVVVAMTYINALTERKVFLALKSWLTQKKLTYLSLFWITGILTFFISSLADNLTTAIAMSALIVNMGNHNQKFVALSCINIVIAANAGGAFSPFGDITTLMVWQAGKIPFATFFNLFLPSVINYVIPAFLMSFALPKGSPKAEIQKVKLTTGGKRIFILFLLTIATAVVFQSYFNLPAALGMMTGLGYLQFFAYYTAKTDRIPTFEVFPAIKELDWDMLLFFYGIILCIGGLSTLGYLEFTSTFLYTELGKNLSAAFQHTPGNILIGILSAVIDNIPLMFSVLDIDPTMSAGQWLLVTLTAGVGGSLLSIGSAAGVGVMGQAPGIYTFFTHLKWIWAIALGYIGSILFHLWWNAHLF